METGKSIKVEKCRWCGQFGVDGLRIHKRTAHADKLIELKKQKLEKREKKAKEDFLNSLQLQPW